MRRHQRQPALRCCHFGNSGGEVGRIIHPRGNMEKDNCLFIVTLEQLNSRLIFFFFIRANNVNNELITGWETMNPNPLLFFGVRSAAGTRFQEGSLLEIGLEEKSRDTLCVLLEPQISTGHCFFLLLLLHPA